jgi:predicted TIM-barrel fold metal-dependent hydrolase
MSNTRLRAMSDTRLRAMSDTRLWDGEIVDAHQHFWDPTVNNHPWLAPEAAIPFRYGDYSAIKRRYLPDDYRADAAGCNITQTVYVETEWDPADPIGETRYATGLTARYGLPSAIVAQAWLDRSDAEDVIAAQAAFPLVRSVRHKPGGPATPAEVGECTTLMSDPVWRRGYAVLGRFGLHFDLQTPWWNLPEAARLAQDFPATLIILNHAGLPGARDPDTVGLWRQAMADFSRCPNTVVKVSGMGEPGQAWTAERNAAVVRSIIDLFGPDRAMFGSNFPVDSLCAGFAEIETGMQRIMAGYERDVQAAFFGGTARRVYRLG